MREANLIDQSYPAEPYALLSPVSALSINQSGCHQEWTTLWQLNLRIGLNWEMSKMLNRSVVLITVLSTFRGLQTYNVGGFVGDTPWWLLVQIAPGKYKGLSTVSIVNLDCYNVSIYIEYMGNKGAIVLEPSTRGPIWKTACTACNIILTYDPALQNHGCGLKKVDIYQPVLRVTASLRKWNSRAISQAKDVITTKITEVQGFNCFCIYTISCSRTTS